MTMILFLCFFSHVLISEPVVVVRWTLMTSPVAVPEHACGACLMGISGQWPEAATGLSQNEEGPLKKGAMVFEILFWWSGPRLVLQPFGQAEDHSGTAPTHGSSSLSFGFWFRVLWGLSECSSLSTPSQSTSFWDSVRAIQCGLSEWTCLQIQTLKLSKLQIQTLKLQ